MNHSDAFGDIRSVLQRPPSAQTWEELCSLVSDWRAPNFEEAALPYILAHLEEWPDRLRTSPLRWRWGLATGISLPFDQMIRLMDLGATQLGNEELQLMAQAPVMQHTVGLRLVGPRISWRGLKHLVESPAEPMRGLRALALVETGIGSAGLRLLAQAEVLEDLEELVIQSTALMPEGLEHLTALPNLRAVSLIDCDLSERHIAALTHGEHFDRWDALCLDDNPLGSRGALRLLHRANVKNLTSLSMAGCKLGEEAIDIVARSSRLGRLTTLRIGHNELLGRIRALGRSRGLSHLHRLDIGGTSHTPDVLKSLLSAEELTDLHVLGVDARLITAELSEWAQGLGRRLASSPLPLLPGLFFSERAAL